LFVEHVFAVAATQAVVVFKPLLQLGIVTGIVTLAGAQLVPLQTLTLTGQDVGPAAGAFQVAEAGAGVANIVPQVGEVHV
jgi:hypothetical protein